MHCNTASRNNFSNGWVILCVAAIGCGTGAYDQKATDRLAQLKREAPFAALQPPADIAGTSVKIGMPKILPRIATLETADPTNPNGKISPERVKLAQLKLPGVYCVYDAEGELGDGNKSVMACQIAVIPKSAPEAVTLPALLDAGLKLLFPTQQVALAATEVEGLDGKKIPWQSAQVETELLFDVYPSNPNEPMQFKKLPGRVAIWWNESEHYHTLLIWRAPTAMDDRFGLLKLAPLSAATLSVGPPPAPAEPAADAAAGAEKKGA